MSVKSKVEIIEEVAAYYSEDVTRRGIELGMCDYWSEKVSKSGENKVCAVGYCLKEPERFQEISGGVGISENILSMEDLKVEYQVDDLEFWGDLQHFHDKISHWDDKGLTKKGKDCLADLKSMYAED